MKGSLTLPLKSGNNEEEQARDPQDPASVPGLRRKVPVPLAPDESAKEKQGDSCYQWTGVHQAKLRRNLSTFQMPLKRPIDWFRQPVRMNLPPL